MTIKSEMINDLFQKDDEMHDKLTQITLFNIRLPLYMKQALDQYCEDKHLQKSKLIRNYLRNIVRAVNFKEKNGFYMDEIES